MEYEPLDERRPPSVSAPPRRRSRRLLRWTWPLLATLLIGAISGVAIAAAIHVPRVESLASFTPSLVTQLYDKNGNVFPTFARERRVMLKESEIPPRHAAGASSPPRTPTSSSTAASTPWASAAPR